MRRSHQLSAELISKDLQTSCGQQCVESFLEWVSMAEQLHASLTSPSAMQSGRCRGVKHTTTGLWSTGDVFSGMTNHT
ncbi:unnamed protein product, partial [Staurois parvus]